MRVWMHKDSGELYIYVEETLREEMIEGNKVTTWASAMLYSDKGFWILFDRESFIDLGEL